MWGSEMGSQSDRKCQKWEHNSHTREKLDKMENNEE